MLLALDEAAEGLDAGVTDIDALLVGWPVSLERLRALTGAGVPLVDVTLHAPVGRQGKFLAVAANYQSDIDEVKASNPAYVPPTWQRWSTKLPSCINGPYDPILQPPESAQLDYEVELALVIGSAAAA